MTKEKLHISFPVIVEGKYDKIRLSNIMEGQIITTDGFGVFRQKEKRIKGYPIVSIRKNICASFWKTAKYR